MHLNYLEKIIDRKFQEVASLNKKLEEDPHHPIHEIIQKGGLLREKFKASLKKNNISIIAEIKRRSPSKGHFKEIKNPDNLALQYCQGGAAAISVLTDQFGFGGSLCDLSHISKTIQNQFPLVPVLRKDFVVHPIQLAESVHAGADCVLLIVKVLKNKLSDFIAEASRLGLETLTEVHDEADIEIANQAGAPIIGINHRNLSSFQVDLGLSQQLKPLLHSACISVAESGIQSAEEVQKLDNIGYDAVLIGEALVTAKDPARLIMQMRGGC
jgi:indole-3-glycerol phosphate synthase